MVYKQGVAAAIKVAGKVLRESSGEVEIPFGSEYSILLRNRNSVRVMAKIEIDGQDVTDGWLVVGPNDRVELERYIRNGNLQQGNRFKFIERTAEIEENRGSDIDDGMIRIEYKTEKVYVAPIVKETHHYHYDHYWPYYRPYYYSCFGGLSSGSILSGQGLNGSSGLMLSKSSLSAPTRTIHASCGTSHMEQAMQQNVQCVNNVSFTASETSVENEAGITVPGSISDQKFQNVIGFDTESNSEVLTLRLVGRVKSAPVVVARTVDIRAKCQTCGKRAGTGDAEYCSRCGTSLKII